MADDTNSSTSSLQLICTTCGSTMTFTPPVRKGIGTFIFRLGLATLILGFLLWWIHVEVEASWEKEAYRDYILKMSENPKKPFYMVCMENSIAPCFCGGLLLAIVGGVLLFTYDTKMPDAKKAHCSVVCPECKSRKSLIALDSPMGQKIYKDTHPSS